jgi:hypothetical protein
MLRDYFAGLKRLPGDGWRFARTCAAWYGHPLLVALGFLRRTKNVPGDVASASQAARQDSPPGRETAKPENA